MSAIVSSLALAREYGSAVDTAEGAREYLRAVTPPRNWGGKILSPGAYAGQVQLRWSWTRGIDWRLVAAGWNFVSPRQWAGGETPLLREFLAYWDRAAGRPEVVGSSHNRLTPAQALLAWRAGIPAGIARDVEAQFLVPRSGGTRRVPRERLARLALAARASRRTSVTGRNTATRNISLKALAALGKLCPELQRAALASLPVGWTTLPVRIRDLDWEAVSRLQRALQADTTGRVRAAWSEGKRQAALLHRFEGPLCPTYPRAPLEIAARLARGESPLAISASLDYAAHLTRAEAHAWMSDVDEGHGRPLLAWWCDYHHVPRVRAWAIARWALAVRERGQWEQLTRERELQGPAGARATVRYLDRLDEVQECDLVRGTRTGVEAAYRSAAERAGSAWLEKARKDHRVLRSAPADWRLYPRCMRVLTTPAQLAREGDEMGHCVGGYAHAVESGHSVIVALSVLGHRSTAELDRSGAVRQHTAAQNGAPHPLCERVLARFVARIGGQMR